jgi:hypothetical protein
MRLDVGIENWERIVGIGIVVGEHSERWTIVG